MKKIPSSKEFERSKKIIFFAGSAVSLLLIISACTLFVLLALRPPVTGTKLEISEDIVVEKKLDKTIWTFEVLYSDEITPFAQTTIQTLSTNGYTIEATGSANSERPTTTLNIKPEMKQEADLLLKDLSQYLTITTFATDLISERVNAQITLGESQ